MEAERIERGARAKLILKKNMGGWLLMLPCLVLFVFFVWYPLVENIIISFFETDSFFNKVDFVGFEKYMQVFRTPKFASALFNTLKYTFYSILIGFPLPLALGLLLSEAVHLRPFFRIGIYFPSIIAGLAVVILWKYLYEPVIGLNSVFGTNYPFLSDANAAIPLIVLTMTWRGAGGTVLIYLSALQTVDDSLYEAAKMDGAGPWRRIFSVTLPHILPNIRMLFILQIISVFQVFYEPLVMTGGGPNGASYSLMQLSYEFAFGVDNDASMAAAVGVILSLLIITLTVVYLRLSKPRD